MPCVSASSQILPNSPSIPLFPFFHVSFFFPLLPYSPFSTFPLFSSFHVSFSLLFPSIPPPQCHPSSFPFIFVFQSLLCSFPPLPQYHSFYFLILAFLPSFHFFMSCIETRSHLLSSPHYSSRNYVILLGQPSISPLSLPSSLILKHSILKPSFILTISFITTSVFHVIELPFPPLSLLVSFASPFLLLLYPYFCSPELTDPQSMMLS